MLEFLLDGVSEITQIGYIRVLGIPSYFTYILFLHYSPPVFLFFV